MDSVSFVTDTSLDGLSRISWRFVFMYGKLYLDEYRKEVRASKRHKLWTTKECYLRLGRDRDYPWGCQRASVSILTEEIKIIALNEFMASIQVAAWDRV